MYLKSRILLGLLVVVLLVPHAPVAAQLFIDAVDDIAVTAENTPVDIGVLDNDNLAGFAPSSLTIVTPPSNGSAMVGGGGIVTYTPGLNFAGNDSFSYEVCVEVPLFGDDCDTANVSITVTENHPPVANDDSAMTDEDVAVVIDVVANDTDIDGNLDPTSVFISAMPANGMAVSNGDGTVTYTPAENYFGPDTFNYLVCDTEPLCDEAVVTIEIAPVNDPPDCSAATGGSIWPPNHKMVGVDVGGVTDVDGDQITIVILSATSDEPENGLGDGNTAPDVEGNSVRAERSGLGDGRVYEVSFEASDGNGGTCTGTVLVEVPHDQRGGNAANNAAMPGDQPGDFGCDHPGNYCNAPGHNKGGDSEPALTTSQQSNNNSSNQGKGKGKNNNNGNHGNGNNASANSQGRGPK